jgi:hypothetical protein
MLAGHSSTFSPAVLALLASLLLPSRFNDSDHLLPSSSLLIFLTSTAKAGLDVPLNPTSSFHLDLKRHSPPPNMPRRHSGSLVPKHFHDERLLRLMASPLTNKMVGTCTFSPLFRRLVFFLLTALCFPAFICAKTHESVRCRDPPTPPQTPPATPGSSPDSSKGGDELPSLGNFIKTIMRKSKCHVPTLLCTLVYLERLKERLPSHARGCHTTRHRVFLASLIVAAKYLNGSSFPQTEFLQTRAKLTISPFSFLFPIFRLVAA